MRNTSAFSVRKSVETSSYIGQEDNIKMILKECDVMKWIQLAQTWRSSVRTSNVGFYKIGTGDQSGSC